MSVNLQKEFQEGVDASRWLEDETTKKFFRLVRDGIYQRWAESPVQDKEGQYTLRLMLKLLDDIEANARTIAQTGELAALQIRGDSVAARARTFLNKYGVRV